MAPKPRAVPRACAYRYRARARTGTAGSSARDPAVQPRQLSLEEARKKKKISGQAENRCNT